MSKTLVICLFIATGLAVATQAFNFPASNLERLDLNRRTKDVGLDLCPWCINEAVASINILLNLILDEGIIGSCGDLCGALANKTGSVFAGDICDVVCDGLGIDEFIHEIIKVDLDPIWYCEIADLCPINDKGDAKFVNFGVMPATGPQGTTFVIDCSFKSNNGTGTSMLRIEMTDPTNQTSSNDYLIEAQKPGTYPERIGLKTLYAMNCDPSHEICDDFPVGTYNVTAQFCNGECGSQHPHSQIYDVGKGAFTVTKKK